MTADEALERAAQLLEGRAGCEPYRKAWKVAARVVRGMKKLTDSQNANQITGQSPGSR